MTYSDIMSKYEGNFVVASVVERNPSGKAIDFMVLHKDTQKANAKERYEYYRAFSENVLLIPVFNKRQITFGKITEGTVVIEPLMTPAEDASFFRVYMGLT